MKGDSVKPIRRLLVAELLSHMVGDGLSLPVGVRRQKNIFCVLRLPFQLLKDFPLSPDRDVFRLES